MIPTLIFLSLSLLCSTALSVPQRVIVTGAGGQTGQALFRKMLDLPDEFMPLGIVRTQESKEALVSSGVPEDNVAVVDVSGSSSGSTIQEAIQSFCTDEEPLAAFCIATSAKPAPIGQDEDGKPIFGFPNGAPEQVDWIGQQNQIDACPPGTHIVVCSSMGGTDPSNRLNAFGRETLEDGSHKGGNILLWKRKAEVYLMDKCKNNGDYSYTIVHPGGLVNEPGGEREIVVGVDDEQTGTESRSIPRDDVASVMLNAVRYRKGAFKNRSFDIRAKPVGEGTATVDYENLLEGIKGRNSDYSLGKTM
ncbi:Complex I intermediate-associated protein 30 domain containing protein [Seminavis robusta]|uniref:Complex I intermediate-associated protein 30 domain containing protein n=1 Tax=Seminavis robusta TaxID=568900 RepID=A0A9N8E102_9STRA|nr:Complex I intermediate-associated protein 30 domain containing protein [Seminavis robusta]|eukprot:Sro541_g163070.1 Complex I intermediate-associated protein 30 domain containing protein (305) ;mRNA; f:1553-2467